MGRSKHILSGSLEQVPECRNSQSMLLCGGSGKRTTGPAVGVALLPLGLSLSLVLPEYHPGRQCRRLLAAIPFHSAQGSLSWDCPQPHGTGRCATLALR